MKTEVDYTKEIDFGIAKILVLANIINRKTELCCFCSDVAHIRKIEIKLHKDVKSYLKEPITFEISYDIDEQYSWRCDSSDRLEEINRCVEFLEKTLKDKKIDYSMIHAVKEYVITSYEI